MPIFRVTLKRVIGQESMIQIEADSTDEAREIASEREDPPDILWTTVGFTFGGETVVTKVEEEEWK